MLSWAGQQFEKLSVAVAPPPTDANGRFLYAIQKGDEEGALGSLHEVDAARTVLNPGKGSYAIHLACQQSMDRLIRALLNVPGVDLTFIDSQGNSPLHYATMSTDPVRALPTIKMLVAEFGASVVTKNSFGQTPYDLAGLDMVRQYLLPLQLQEETRQAINNGGVGLVPGMDMGGLRINNPVAPPPPIMPGMGMGMKNSNSNIAAAPMSSPAPHHYPTPQHGAIPNPPASGGGQGGYALSGGSSAAIYKPSDRRVYKADGFHSSSSDVNLQRKYGNVNVAGAAGAPPPPSSGNAPTSAASGPNPFAGNANPYASGRAKSRYVAYDAVTGQTSTMPAGAPTGGGGYGAPAAPTPSFAIFSPGGAPAAGGGAAPAAPAAAAYNPGAPASVGAYHAAQQQHHYQQQPHQPATAPYPGQPIAEQPAVHQAYQTPVQHQQPAASLYPGQPGAQQPYQAPGQQQQQQSAAVPYPVQPGAQQPYQAPGQQQQQQPATAAYPDQPAVQQPYQTPGQQQQQPATTAYPDQPAIQQPYQTPDQQQQQQQPQQQYDMPAPGAAYGQQQQPHQGGYPVAHQSKQQPHQVQQEPASGHFAPPDAIQPVSAVTPVATAQGAIPAPPASGGFTLAEQTANAASASNLFSSPSKAGAEELPQAAVVSPVQTVTQPLEAAPQSASDIFGSPVNEAPNAAVSSVAPTQPEASLSPNSADQQNLTTSGPAAQPEQAASDLFSSPLAAPQPASTFGDQPDQAPVSAASDLFASPSSSAAGGPPMNNAGLAASNPQSQATSAESMFASPVQQQPSQATVAASMFAAPAQQQPATSAENMFASPVQQQPAVVQQQRWGTPAGQSAPGMPVAGGVDASAVPASSGVQELFASPGSNLAPAVVENVPTPGERASSPAASDELLDDVPLSPDGKQMPAVHVQQAPSAPHASQGFEQPAPAPAQNQNPEGAAAPGAESLFAAIGMPPPPFGKR